MALTISSQVSKCWGIGSSWLSCGTSARKLSPIIDNLGTGIKCRDKLSSEAASSRPRGSNGALVSVGLVVSGDGKGNVKVQ
ncbi:hypothetical protein Tco_0651511 [Tanacetum coccineum]|uniref:Uncharacterized protein n=1 Tax=Tanacetum coccineum TaxID=301880 RepID=A0ABQ4WV12_9ASTR